ncbi:TRAP transporter substrate-binding protein [Bosea sp. ANAM02]|uniref:TRAP transporter substrate-binding protein n=1 Tax=Bosea sp. ANAM02 TaxID=2020412 RepID=UPI00140EF6BC|nr:TRAP transporter substrate-binding protein [Bosea sp. ANAM02]BCB19421.1 transporter [Bosea sp. ANAM02]
MARACDVATTCRPPGRVQVAIAALAAMLAFAGGAAPAQTRPEEPVKLQIIGGLASLTQYTRIEQPFWQSEIATLSKGRVTATIRPLDAGGLRTQEMLQLMRLGVVSFGTALLSAASGDEPELSAIDLPLLNPDVATLRRTVGAFREHLRDVLRERYDIRLLGIYTYPAQVLFCTKPFKGLDDLAGRKVRTSSVAQSELMTAMGAFPVILPLAEVVAALRGGVADCAITGTLSGYEIGLPRVAVAVHALALNWGVSIFGANGTYWDALPADARDIIRQGVGQLETRIWSQAEADTQRGLACNAGTEPCSGKPERPMTEVPALPADATRRRLLAEVVLPRWFERCGQDCVSAWNTYLKPLHAIEPRTP